MHLNTILLFLFTISFVISCNSSKNLASSNKEENNKIKKLTLALTENETKLDSLQSLIDTESDCSFQFDSLKDEYDSFIKNQQINISSLPKTPPIKNVQSQQIIGFGRRLHPIYQLITFHNGIDIVCPKNTAIYSTIKGKVEYTRKSNQLLGNHISITTTDNIKIVFAHLEEILVVENESVQVGQKVGTVGNTGRSVSPHLHYSLFIKDINMNPIFTIDHLFPREEIINISCNKKVSLD